MNQSEHAGGSRRPSADLLETFDNPHPGRDYVIETVCPEFTSLCPKTGQPDFGTITISYVPDRLCFELKSLKLYLQQYRNEGAFYEDVANRILDDLVAATRPRSMKLTAAFTPRGGIRTNVHVEYHAALGRQSSDSIIPRLCSRWATSEQRVAQTSPAVQPASTSVG